MKDNILNLLVNKISIHRIDRSPKEIANFIQAIKAAESPTNPIRKTLLDIFQRMLLDGHLHAIYKKRIRNVKNTRLLYFEDGKDTAQINKDYFESPWFLDVIRYSMQSIFWGHSLIEFQVEKGIITKANLVNRMNVRPEKNIVVKYYSDQEGFDYTIPPYSAYTFPVQAEDELGLFTFAAICTLLKQGGTVDFSNFVEKYGSPIQEFQYDPHITNAREEVEKTAREAGNSSTIIVPKDHATLTLHQGVTAGTDKLHDTFLKNLKEELSILFLGQTMTTSDGSSLSQAQVHQDEQGQITKEDKIFIEYNFNYTLKQKLINLGVPISEKGYFKFVEENNLSLADQLDIDIKLNSVIPIDQDYFYNKYKIPKPSSTSSKKAKSDGYPFAPACSH